MLKRDVSLLITKRTYVDTYSHKNPNTLKETNKTYH